MFKTGDSVRIRGSNGYSGDLGVIKGKADTKGFWLVDLVQHKAVVSIPEPCIALHDPVNHPSHYTSHPSGVECIEIARHMNFNCGNAIKYLWRAGLKTLELHRVLEKHIEDLEKAIWYLTDEVKRLKKLCGNTTSEQEK